MTRIAVPVRWGDLDAQGHVNNSAFADYLQEARVDYLFGGGAATEALVTDGAIVVTQQIEYKAPIFFGSAPVTVDVWPCSVGAARFTLAYRLWQGEREVAVARTKLCPYSLASAEPCRLSAAARQWLLDQVEAAEPFQPLPWKPLKANARSAPMRVRWSDIDAYGHVNNVLYFNYIMEGRIAFTAAAVPSVNASIDSGYLWFIVRQDVDYLKPMTFRVEPYVVRTGVSHMGRTSLTFVSEIVDRVGGDRYAQASTVAVFADAHGHPIPVREEWKQELAPYRV
ncbi:MAG: thioesterase family protein [Propionibacteriaceae bacterium]|nr:thioesterase family protein [Propionibacteriaceae bacterium]